MANAGKSTRQQQLARQWSRMNAKDRAMSKAIHKYQPNKPMAPGQMDNIVAAAFLAGHAVEQKEAGR